MDLSLDLGAYISTQDNYVIAQLFSEPIDSAAFWSCAVSVVTALFVHSFLCLLTSLFYRM